MNVPKKKTMVRKIKCKELPMRKKHEASDIMWTKKGRPRKIRAGGLPRTYDRRGSNFEPGSFAAIREWASASNLAPLTIEAKS